MTDKPESKTTAGLVVASRDPHAHWIRSADGLTSWNPAPDASPAGVPNAVTVTLKVGNEFARYHPQASHVSPDHRDGWNHCFDSAQAIIDALRADLKEVRELGLWRKSEMERLTLGLEAMRDLTGDSMEQLRQERDAAMQEARDWRKQHRDLKAKQVADIEALTAAGAPMANTMFNLAQQTHKFDDYHRKLFKSMQVRWDAAREALRAQLTKDRT